MVSRPDQHPFLGSGVSFIMPDATHVDIVVCEVGAAPRGRPFPGMEDGLAQGPVPTG